MENCTKKNTTMKQATSRFNGFHFNGLTDFGVPSTHLKDRIIFISTALQELKYCLVQFLSNDNVLEFLSTDCT